MILVGLALSLFIVAVSITYLVSSSTTFKAQTNESIIQENARFALEIMTQHIRTAGSNPSNNGLAVNMDTIFTGAICQSGEAAGAGGTTSCTRDGVDAANKFSDRLGLDFGMSFPGTTCSGQTVTPGVGQVVSMASVFWTADLDDPQDGVRSLYCQSFRYNTGTEVYEAFGPAVPLVDGVERMQVQYGIDRDENGLIEAYKSYTNLIKPPAKPYLPGEKTATQTVRVVRIAMLISSGLGTADTTLTGGLNANSEKEATHSYEMLDAPAEEFADDQVLKQIFSTSVAIHNSL